ncbi:glycosyltransferase family 9 protein [Actinokineospora bangkokensis]|uniref:Glycosyl transferase n=1 Tax=Actinokineospora bangkokensis TaxID=1193682 RepID=A0A1Q9LLS3_9PSEU|nr:glycosyltransferase family 9 protein [Actinokineospora bangkokensis]OLR92943.1 glycosyl transferase [Actinokineospora bangkokensis]
MRTPTGRVLVVRLDSDGDVLTAGPAVRAIAAHAEVVLLCGPGGAQAARMLPGVDDVVVWECPWVVATPPPVAQDDLDDLVARIRRAGCGEAVVLTSFHQSPLPTALLLRMAGVQRITGASVDYPGSLLDVRVRPGVDFDEGCAEPLRSLAIASAAGYAPSTADDTALRVRGVVPADIAGPYVVVHPGSLAPSRTCSPGHWASFVAHLARAGHRVVVTGSPAERALTREVSAGHALDLGGRTTYAELAGVLAGAEVVVVGNTGPAHLSAAVGTPVVSLFSPVVPASRWAPHGVATVVLGDQEERCRDTRSRECPIPGHPCLDGVTPEVVADAVRLLAGVAV